MPNSPKDINAEVMNKIRSGELKMKPRLYFIIGSIAMVSGLILSFVSATFLINLGFFFSRAHGPMRDYRLASLLQSLPWWVPVLAIISIIVGIILLKKYDFSYQKNFALILVGIVLALIGTAWILDYTQLNDLWFKRGPMRRYFNQESTASSTRFFQGRGMRWNGTQK
jgi:uncharacterized membrane protein HdeD (DUF308 family)